MLSKSKALTISRAFADDALARGHVGVVVDVTVNPDVDEARKHGERTGDWEPASDGGIAGWVTVTCKTCGQSEAFPWGRIARGLGASAPFVECSTVKVSSIRVWQALALDDADGLDARLRYVHWRDAEAAGVADELAEIRELVDRVKARLRLNVPDEGDVEVEEDQHELLRKAGLNRGQP